MSIQNSIYAPTPIAVNKGGTANTGTLANGQTWVGNGTATPAIAALTGTNGIAVTNGSGTITVGQATTLTNGQLWVGNTGSVPTAATLTAGNTNIQVTNGSGSITLNAAPVWTTSTSTLTPGVGIIGGTASYTLPGSPAIGDTYVISCNAASGFVIHANGNLINYSGILYGSTLTTTSHSASIAILYVGVGIFNVLWISPGSTFTGV